MVDQTIPGIPLLEKLARDLCVVQRIDPDAPVMVDMKTVKAWESRIKQVRVILEGLMDPPEQVWDGLPRAMMMWLDMGDKTPRALFQHLVRTAEKTPKWLVTEPEMQRINHVPSKGTRCVIIFRAMIENALEVRS